MDAPNPDLSLPQYLAARARHASDARLVANAVGGLAALAALLWWRPPLWMQLGSAAACFLAYGLWGIGDRELRDRATGAAPATLTALRALRAAALALGGAAMVTFLLALTALALGTLIS
jgi:hypothetical protein